MRAEYDMSHGTRGAVVSSKGKTRVTLYIDNVILEHYREIAENIGKGYQTLINEALKESIKNKQANSVATLRRVIREELKKAINH